MTWKMTDAENRLTEVVDRALSEGPQTITRRNDTVILISAAKFADLTGHRPGFKDYLAQGDSFEGLDLARDQSSGRDIEL
jgi:antitoxin Phd